MKTVIGILLIVAALFLGYLGVNQVQKSANSVEVLGIELSAEDKGGKETGYIELALGVVSLVAGIYLLGKKKN
jgi:TRAP-type C4-dicarboxylate transport system permease small subunit